MGHRVQRLVVATNCISSFNRVNRIHGTPEEYSRVTKTICLLSPELVMVDAYVSPCKKDVFEVLQAILNTVA